MLNPNFVPNPSKLLSEQPNTLRCTLPSFLIDLLCLLQPKSGFWESHFRAFSAQSAYIQVVHTCRHAPKTLFFPKKLTTVGSFQLPEPLNSILNPFESVAQGSQYRRISIWCVYQTSDFSETVFGLCHLTVKPLRGDKIERSSMGDHTG